MPWIQLTPSKTTDWSFLTRIGASLVRLAIRDHPVAGMAPGMGHLQIPDIEQRIPLERFKVIVT